MNIKEWIIPVILATATVMMVQRFVIDRFFVSSPVAQEITDFVAPAHQPLKKEIDFVDGEKHTPEDITEIPVEWGHVSFSSHGACLQAIDFNHSVDGRIETIRTVFPPNSAQKEHRCFLLALDEATPFFYELIDHSDDQDHIYVSYRAPFSHGTLTKTYTVYKQIHQIDLTCACELTGHDAVKMRIVYPAPFMADLDKNADLASILIDRSDAFKRTARSSLDTHKGWYAPHMFGTENMYFIHAMISDNDAFTQQAYYAFVDKDQLLSFLEGPEITESASWKMSFYFGPKEHHALAAVDTKLEQTLAYAGVFAPVSKLFLKILNFFYEYVENYGIAIILLTLLIKLVFLPFSMNSESRMKKQQEMANQMSYLKQRFKDDPERLAREQAALIKKYGIPGAGCLPMLLQIPVFIAMRNVLANSIELYQAPFLWIKDLSARDPYYVLPMLLVIAMFVQAAYSDKSQRATLIAMGILLGAFMANFAAGLVLYFVIHSLLAALQTQGLRYFKRA